MISAQIKKGNSFLIDSVQDTLLQIITLSDHKQVHPIKFTFYQFICLLSELCSEFVKSQLDDVSFNIFLVDYHMRKYQKDSQIYRHLMGLTHSWKRYIDIHEDAKLFLSLLADNRNSRIVMKEFIKIRKTILKTLNQKILTQISVTHSDALAICHILHQGQKRTKVIKKINELFISLKRKLINTAKINGAVACQFFMNAAQELTLNQYPLQEKKILPNKKVYKSQTVQFPFNVSFSEEFASCYRKEQIAEKQKVQTKNAFSNVEDLQKEWQVENELQFGFPQAKMSLKQLFQKDQDIDAKLKGSGIMKNKHYPEGWDEFLKTNQLIKQKLLNYKPY